MQKSKSCPGSSDIGSFRYAGILFFKRLKLIVLGQVRLSSVTQFVSVK